MNTTPLFKHSMAALQNSLVLFWVSRFTDVSTLVQILLMFIIREIICCPSLNVRWVRGWLDDDPTNAYRI